MATLANAVPALSTLCRISLYVFLQVIPKRELLYVAFLSYALHIAATYLAPAPPIPVVALQEEVVAITEKPKENGSVETEVAVVEATAVVPEPINWRDALSTLAFSLPSPARPLRQANLLINTLLLLAAVDFVAFPYFDDASDVVFTRVGALYPDAAKIVVRYPAANATDNLVRIAWRQTGDAVATPPWKNGPLLNLTAASDWAGTARVDGLWPSTSYEYVLKHANNSVLPYPDAPIRFRTFPDPRLHTGTHFRFIATSCSTPNFPYRPFKGRSIKGFDLLANYLWPASAESEPVAATVAASAPSSPTPENVPAAAENATEDTSLKSPVTAAVPTENVTTAAVPIPVPAKAPQIPTEFMIFLGDFIYADVPFYVGDDKDAYKRLYRRNYASPSFRKVYEKLPIFHMYDDHEIINNFVGESNSSTAPFQNASNAYELYAADANYDPTVKGENYYNFRYGDAAFFVMDTRRHRSDITVDDVSAHTMLGDKQLTALYDWLGKVNNTATFKFIVSSVPFTSLWQHDALTDSWAGYAAEKSALLAALHSVPNVLILSGDRHEFAAIEFVAPEGGHNVLEVSTSPLSMFYVPFFRTLKPRSEEVVNRTRDVVTTAEDGSQVVEQVVVEVPQEKVLKYIATGNYKWSSIEVDTRDSQHPVVKVEIMINGASAYTLDVVGTPVKLHSTTALGAIVPDSLRGFLDRIGIKPSRWF